MLGVEIFLKCIIHLLPAQKGMWLFFFSLLRALGLRGVPINWLSKNKVKEQIKSQLLVLLISNDFKLSLVLNNQLERFPNTYGRCELPISGSMNRVGRTWAVRPGFVSHFAHLRAGLPRTGHLTRIYLYKSRLKNDYTQGDGEDSVRRYKPGVPHSRAVGASQLADRCHRLLLRYALASTSCQVLELAWGTSPEPEPLLRTLKPEFLGQPVSGMFL